MDLSSLTDLADHHLELAHQAPSGRSAHTVFGGHHKTLRQTLFALTAGQELSEHENPGEATLQVLSGQVRMAAGDVTREATAGDLVIIPDSRHSLAALVDSVVLLTVAKLG